jgi:hypothetical protein
MQQMDQNRAVGRGKEMAVSGYKKKMNSSQIIPICMHLKCEQMISTTDFVFMTVREI